MGDTPQEAVRAALRALGEPYASEMEALQETSDDGNQHPGCERFRSLNRRVDIQDRQSDLTSPQTMWARRVAQERGALTHERDEQERARAFRALAEDSLRDAYRLAGAILRDPVEAEDAVHDAFVIGWQKWTNLRDTSKFEAWFRRIVVNVCRDHLRRRKRRPSDELDESLNAAVPPPALDVHDRLQLEQSMARLDVDDRLVLALRYYRDLKVDDVAAALDVSPGTVKSRLSRARGRLRAELEASERSGGAT